MALFSIIEFLALVLRIASFSKHVSILLYKLIYIDAHFKQTLIYLDDALQ